MTTMEKTITLNPEASRLNLPASFLTELAEAIVGAVDVDSIYIFGSYARGEERPDSDIDICVVTKEPESRFLEKMIAVRKASDHLVWKNGFDEYDLVCVGKKNFDFYAGDRTLVYRNVHDEGIKLYG